MGDVADSYSGGTPAVGKNEYYGGNIPFIRSAEINSNSTELFITEIGLENSSAKMVTKGTILYALYGATSGECGISQINGAINQAILAIVPKNNFDAYFLTTWLRNSKSEIISTYLQGGQGNLSGAIVKNLDLEVPCINEQHQIGSYFNKLDNLITLHQRKLETLKEIKKSLLQKIFNQEIRFKDDDGSEFPEWENYVFKDVFLNLKNNCFSRAELTDEIRTIRNVHYGDILIKFSSSFVDTSIEQLPYLMNDIPSLSELQKLQSGDVIFADTAEDYTAGKAIELQNIEGEIVSGLHTIPCRPIIEHYIGFFAYYLNSPAFHDQLIPLITGTKVMAINKGQLAKTFLQIPSIKEQTKITKLLSKFDKKIELAENKLAALKEMKKGLLQKMFI